MTLPAESADDLPSGGSPSLGRAAFYVDGFNFYHALAGLEEHERYYKWLDWQKLARMIAGPAYNIVKVVFCTASPKHKAVDVQERHRAYIDALTATGVEIKSGWFLSEPQNCRECSNEWERYTEKEGDVSLALSLIEDAYENVFDTAFLVSSDSDQAPTLRLIRNRFDENSGRAKKIIAVFPAWRGEDATSRKLSSCAHDARRVGRPMLKGSLLPPTVPWQISEKNLRLVRRPREYDPPA